MIHQTERAPAEDAREEVQDELVAFAEWFGTPSTNLSEGVAALVQYWAQEAWQERARRATSVPAIPGTGREKKPYGFAVEARDGHITFFKERPTGFDQPRWGEEP